MKKLVLATLLCAAVAQVTVATTFQFDLQGTAGPGLLPGNEPGAITGGTGGEIGAGIFFDDTTSQLTINVGWGSSQGFTDLSSLANNSHIHGPTAGNLGNDGTGNFKQTAGVLVTLTRSSDAVTGGTFTTPPITLTAAQRTDLFNGKYYINIHTVNNGGGELRGFLVPVNPVITQFDLQGTAGPGLLPGNEPGTITGGTGGEIGAGIFFDDSTSRLTINVGWGSSQGFTDLSSLANNSHIHGPTAGNLGNDGTGNFKQTAGVLVTLTRSSNAVTGGTFTDPPILLTAAQRTDLFKGKYYINIHTVNNGGGELRGFLVPAYTVSVALAAQISWFASAGLNYQVQAASVVNSNVWFDLGGQIPGNDAINYYYDPLGANQSRFYRVMTRP